MKNSIVNYLVIAAMVILAAFSGCKKEETGVNDNNGNSSDTSVVTATNVIEGNNNIAKVVAVIELIGDEDYEKAGTNDIIVSTTYQNNSFQFTLPTIDDKYLKKFPHWAIFQETRSTEWANLKTYLLECLVALDVNDDELGILVYGDNMLEAFSGKVNFYCWAYYVYSNIDAKITNNGLYTDEHYKITHDLDLKRGWNLVYENRDNIGKKVTYTTEKLENVNLNWYFIRNGEYKK